MPIFKDTLHCLQEFRPSIQLPKFSLGKVQMEDRIYSGGLGEGACLILELRHLCRMHSPPAESRAGIYVFSAGQFLRFDFVSLKSLSLICLSLGGKEH